jgi:UTP-glucose-1-phosphate uridylyltransferase
VYACEIENGKYFDTGNKLEYMKTAVELCSGEKEWWILEKQYSKKEFNRLVKK